MFAPFKSSDGLFPHFGVFNAISAPTLTLQTVQTVATLQMLIE
jgi:hypothetical protein